VLTLGAAGQTPMHVTLWPAPGEMAACVDGPLSLTFDQTVQPASGSVRIFTADGTLAERIEVTTGLGPAGALPEHLLGGGVGPSHAATRYYPLLVDGQRASLFLHDRLAYDQGYTVEVDAGAFAGADGAPSPAIVGPSVWRFHTRAAPPPADGRELTVAADGQADFCSVQGALDAVPDDPAGPPTTITVRSGTYTEIDEVNAATPPLVVQGQARDTTLIQYPNNNTLNPTSRTRAVFNAEAADFTLQRITIQNLTPNGCGSPDEPCTNGGQAEAFRGDAPRLLLDQVTLRSFQDTLQLGASPTASAFVNASLIEGNVDYTWGAGRALFQDCELRTRSRAEAAAGASGPAYIAQVRNPAGVPGYVYLRCRLSRDDAVADGTTYLARIDPRDGDPPPGFPFSQVVFIDTVMDAHISPLGWLLNNAETGPSVRFWEYHSVLPDGTPLCWTPDASAPPPECSRAAFSRQLSDAEAQTWSDPATVLDGWDPRPRLAAP